MLLLLKVSIKKLCILIYKVFLENFYKLTIQFNPYCLLKKVEENKIDFNLYSLFGLKDFDQNTIWFNPFCILRKFWSKDKTVYSI